MSSTLNKVLLLYSGGLDSLASLILLSQEHETGLLFIDYGQKAAKREQEYSQKAAQHFDVSFTEVELPWYAELASAKSLISGNVPQGPDLSDKEQCLRSAANVWMPNRNGLFLNIAACYAEAQCFGRVAAGFNLEEGASFPDNTALFADAATRAFSYSTSSSVRVTAPLIEMDKKQIAGIVCGAGLSHMFYSCYTGNEPMCGSCESCRRALRAYGQLGKEDEIAGRFGEKAAL